MTEIDTLKRFDIQEHLQTPDDVLRYLEAVFEDGDPKLIAAALGDVARANGMSNIARKAGVTREALYKALSETGDPRLTTFLGVLNALGLRFALVPNEEHAA